MGKARGGGRPSKPRNPRPKRAGDPESSEEEESNYKPSQRGLGRQNDTVGMLPPSDDSEEEEEEEQQQPASANGATAAAADSSAVAGTSAAPAGKAAAPAAVAPPAAKPASGGAVAAGASAGAGQPRKPAAADSDSSDEDDSDDDDDDDDDDSSEEDARPPARRPGVATAGAGAGAGAGAAAAAKPKEAQQHYLQQPSAPRKEPVVERSPEEIRKEMERLELIRKKRESDRVARIAAEGWDRYAPLSDTNRPAGYVPSDHPSKKDGAA